jgi:hypothetical protein
MPSKSMVCKVSCWMPVFLAIRNFVLLEVEVNVQDMFLFFLTRRSCLHKVSPNVYRCHLCKAQHRWLVLSISSKSGGKNGTHCWVPEISSIAAISYMPAQLFEHFIGRQFCAVPQIMTLLQVKQFALLPATAILCPRDYTMEDYGVRKPSDFSLQH